MKKITVTLLVSFLLITCRQNNTGMDFTILPLELSSDASLRGLFVYDDIITCSGSGNTFIISSDGGKNWQISKLFEKENLDFRDVQVLNNNSYLLLTAGQPARIYKTTNRGSEWIMTFEDTRPGVFFNTFEFWNEERGVAFSDPLNNRFLILFTENAGYDWKEYDDLIIPEAYEGEAGFAASGTMMTTFGDGLVWFGTGGSTARVFKSHDFGKTWNAYNTPIMQGKSSRGIFSVEFRDSLNGIIVGGDYTLLGLRDSTAAWTNDGGLNWNLSETLPYGFRSCVTYIQDKNIPYYITTGPGGTDYSIDDGKNWVNIDTLGFHTVCADLFEPETIFLSGFEGKVSRLKREKSQ